MRVLDFSLRPSARRICRVRVGRGALDALVADLAREPPGAPLVLVSDSRVAPLHAAPLAARLARRGLRVALLEFPAGERSKTRETKSRLEDRLLRLGVGRDAALVAVGGGVTADLTGFVAATWHRGVPVVQVPTSLLAMVDAAVGGKTAVNLPQGKNLVGSVHQPWGIYADTSLLATLPERDYREGFAEVVKSAAIGDAPFFGWLETNVERLLDRDAPAVEHVVATCLRIKGRVVRRDERDTGRRGILNFGHTVAHALESATCYRVRHGPAVALGLCVEGRVAVARTGFPPAHRTRLESLLESFGLPVLLPARPSVHALLQAARRDKKARRGRVRCALPRLLGRMLPGAEVTVAVRDDELRRALAASRPV